MSQNSQSGSHTPIHSVSFVKKQEEVKQLFSSCETKEALYQKIIDLGKEQHSLSHVDKVEENLVPGCQSRMYLKASCIQGVCHFETESDALISAGLGQILVRVYSGEEPRIVLQCPPTYIEELGIPSSLTPGRANGLASLYHKMKQHALKWLLQAQTP